MDCIVGTGVTPGSIDPLAQAYSLTNKSLLPIAGQPMVTHVVKALSASRHIQRIFVVGLDQAHGIDFGCPVEYVSGGGSMIDNALAGIRVVAARNPDARHILVSASDIPLLTPRVIDRFIETCLSVQADAYYGIVEKSVMERRFPTSHRTYVRIKEGTFCGGDLFMIGRNAIQTNQYLAKQLADARKNPWKQAVLMGPSILLKLALGTLALAEGERIASKRLNCRCKVIISPDPELAMDVDKPDQLEIARTALEGYRNGK